MEDLQATESDELVRQDRSALPRLEHFIDDVPGRQVLSENFLQVLAISNDHAQHVEVVGNASGHSTDGGHLRACCRCF